MKFTQRKFLHLDDKLQHKKCAEVVRAIYISILNEEEPLQKELYLTLCSWLQLDPITTWDLYTLSERYHWHLNKALLFLKEHNLLPPIRRMDREEKLSFGSCQIYLDNLRSAYNVGSILRTTEALRLGKLLFGGKTPFIDNPKVIKTSMGTSDIVPCTKISSLDSLMEPIIVLDTAEDAIDLSEFLFPEKFTLVIGNEELGVSDPLLEKATAFVDIPLFGKKNSINVACAFAICAKEIRRQWNKQKSYQEQRLPALRK